MFEFTTFLNKLCSLIIGIFLIVVVLLMGASEISHASSSTSNASASGNPNIIATSLSSVDKSLGNGLSRIEISTGQATHQLNRSIKTIAHQTLIATVVSEKFIGSVLYESIRLPFDFFGICISLMGHGMQLSAEYLASGASDGFALVTSAATQSALTKPSVSIVEPVIKPINASTVTLSDFTQKTPASVLPAAAPTPPAPKIASVAPPLPIQTPLVSKAIVQTTVADNLYAWGNCTWWVFIRRSEIGDPIPNSWGNATEWAYSARQDGYLVDHQPSPGAIMQLSGVDHGLGHVAFVESVDPDGTWHISEMNVLGLDVLDHKTEPPSAAAYYNFIHDKL